MIIFGDFDDLLRNFWVIHMLNFFLKDMLRYPEDNVFGTWGC